MESNKLKSDSIGKHKKIGDTAKGRIGGTCVGSKYASAKEKGTKSICVGRRHSLTGMPCRKGVSTDRVDCR